jgi:DNA polymerase-3 subunit gamma/tau
MSLEKVLENSTDLDIQNLASGIDEEFCQLLYEIAVNSYSKFSAHPSPKEALEVCILRMLAFNPIHKIESKQDKSETEKKNLKKHQNDKSEKKNEDLKIKKVEVLNAAGKQNLNNNSDWIKLFDLLSLSPFARNYYGNLSFVSFKESLLTFSGADNENLIPENVSKEFQAVLNSYFGFNIVVEIIKGDSNDSPLNYKKKVESDRQSEAEKNILSDPSIQKFLDKHDGSIKDGSIKPVN